MLRWPRLGFYAMACVQSMGLSLFVMRGESLVRMVALRSHHRRQMLLLLTWTSIVFSRNFGPW